MQISRGPNPDLPEAKRYPDGLLSLSMSDVLKGRHFCAAQVVETLGLVGPLTASLPTGITASLPPLVNLPGN